MSSSPTQKISRQYSCIVQFSQVERQLKTQELGWRSSCQRYIGQFLVALLSLLAFLSPIVMVLLPRLLPTYFDFMV